MLVVDSQVHVWGPDTPERPWVPGSQHRAHRSTPFGVEELLGEMDQAGVDAAILVPPSFEANRNDLALAAAREHPRRLAVMGRIALDSPTEAMSVIESWDAHPGALGFRLTLSRNSDATRTDGGSWLLDGSSDWFWPVAAERALPVMVHCTGLLDRIADIADQYPSIPLIIDHLGLPSAARDAEAGRIIRDLKDLARRKNIAVKAGAIPCYTTEPYPYPLFQNYLREVIEWFAADRVFWGSDLTRLPCSYRQLVEFFSNELGFLSEEERSLILGRGVVSWLRWDAPLQVT
jgi:L-fuconolactonase